MRKATLFMGSALFALTLTHCAKDGGEVAPDARRGFAITAYDANGGTRLATDPDTYTVAWQGDETIGVFITEPGTQTVVRENVPFANSVADVNRFVSDTLSLAAGTYDFYAYYPYSSYINSAGTGYVTLSYQNVSIDPAAPTAHLSSQDFLYGTAAGVDGTPSIALSHLFSLMRVGVTNNYAQPLTLTNFTLATQGTQLGGQFLFNPLTGAFERRTTTWGAEVAIPVNRAPLAAGATFDVFFLANAATLSGETLTMSALTEQGVTFEEQKAITATFTAGRVNTATFSLAQGNVKPAEVILANWPVASNAAVTLPVVGTQQGAELTVGGSGLTQVTGNSGQQSFWCAAWNGAAAYDAQSGQFGPGTIKYWLLTVPASSLAAGDRVNITYRSFGTNASPRDWVLQVSEDNVNWTTLQTYSITSTSLNATAVSIDQTYTLAQATTNLYFRIAVNGTVAYNGGEIAASNGNNRLVEPVIKKL